MDLSVGLYVAGCLVQVFQGLCGRRVRSRDSTFRWYDLTRFIWKTHLILDSIQILEPILLVGYLSCLDQCWVFPLIFEVFEEMEDFGVADCG